MTTAEKCRNLAAECLESSMICDPDTHAGPLMLMAAAFLNDALTMLEQAAALERQEAKERS